MPEGQVLEFAGLSKQFGSVLAVDGFTARVEPGTVTGFLGPNGAGKTTTLRMLLGLVRPTSGTATIGGVPYSKLTQPLQTVGAVLEASSFHPGRTAAAHLAVYAHAAGLPATRVDDALGLVGLADVGGRKVGGFSLGMRQRLGLAGALLGDPGVLVLDEPVNGLDPEGITWMRGLLRELAHQGRTIFMSSHLLAEVQQTVDQLLIISQGRIVYAGALEDLADASEYATLVDSPDRAALETALHDAQVPYEVLRSGLTIRGVDPTAVGRTAADAGVALSMLQRRGPALEQVFFELVSGMRVHPSAQAGAPAPDSGAQAGAGPAVAEAAPEPDAAGDRADSAGADEEAPAQDPPALVATAATGVVAVRDRPRPDEAEPDRAAARAQTPAETRPPGGGFAVASTGVIDIIPAPEAKPEPEPATEAEAEPAGEDTPAPAEETVAPSMQPQPPTGPREWNPPTDWWAPAAPAIKPEMFSSTAAPDDATTPTIGDDDIDDIAGEPDHLNDDVPHEQKTDSDIAADAFFHAFDDGSTGESDASTAASTDDTPAEAAAAEDAADEASTHDASDHDGGESR
jgi:ABC-type multidrug transport system ATPase subunit